MKTPICVVTIAALAILITTEALPISYTNKPSASLSPTQLFFWAHNPPQCSPIAHAVTLTNDGPGVLHINRIAIAGAFTQHNTCGSTLGVGKSGSIEVVWEGGLGEDLGTLYVYDNAANSQTVSLRGVCFYMP
jgi:hypothetical protein